MRADLVVNPVSGGNQGRPGRLRRQLDTSVDVLRRAGIETSVHLTGGPGHATALAAESARAGADVVAAWGGDGTVNEVAAALAGTSTALAIVPAGSGSGLARALGIPLHPQGAIDVIVQRATRRIDVGRIAGRTFVNVAGIGFDARVARAFNADRLARPGRRGLATYVRITVREFFRYAPPRCRIAVGTERLEVDALLIALANSPQYGNGAVIAPDARLDDGEVDIVVVRASYPLRDLLRARRLFDGTIARDAGASILRAARASIEADGPIAFHTDGEPHDGGARLDVEMCPGALRVCVPAR